MNWRILAAGCSGAAMLAACSAPPPGRAPEQLQAGAPQAATAPSPWAFAPHIPPLTLDGYKKALAERIARSSTEIFDEPMPEVLKSIVVLDITIDRDGRLARVAVRRSNGYKALEERAMDSVRRAAPFGAPAATVRGRDGSVNFLETFLFRVRFRILSLVR
jgi:protein TonB